MEIPRPPTAPGAGLEDRIEEIGRELGRTLRRVLDELPGAPRGPQQVAAALGVDKVLASRLLKALRSRDALAIAHHAPGPEPLRRVLKAAARRGVASEAIGEADGAIAAFEDLIKRELGDRSALLALISAWLPEARAEFELRRKQSAFKAMSELKGVVADLNLSAVVLHPSESSDKLDVVWCIGLLGLRRLRPGVAVKLTTRRMVPDGDPRRPSTLEGRPVEGLDGLRLDRFCHAPPAPLEIARSGEVVHYTLGPSGYGPRSAVDLLFAEANRAEMPRRVPRGSGRRGYVFSEVVTPARSLVFDVLVHEDVYPGSEPELLLYDTSFAGVADVNDRGRDLDRLDLCEQIEPLGRGIDRARVGGVPRYVDLLAHVFERLGWRPDAHRLLRVAIDYPLYGSQACVAFRPEER